MSRNLISLVQPNFQQGPKEFNAHYLPYSVGVLWAYVNQFDSIKANYQLEDLIWRRDNIEDTAIKLSKCLRIPAGVMCSFAAKATAVAGPFSRMARATKSRVLSSVFFTTQLLRNSAKPATRLTAAAGDFQRIGYEHELSGFSVYRTSSSSSRVGSYRRGGPLNWIRTWLSNLARMHRWLHQTSNHSGRGPITCLD